MKLSASLYAADPLRLADAVAAVSPFVDSLHIDVMDGAYAPAFGLSLKVVERLAAFGGPPLDVHLMVMRPEDWAERFADAGARSVAFHLEAAADPLALAAAVRRAGAKAHVALIPTTPVGAIPGGISDFDGVLLLTAPAGGGAFNISALERARALAPARYVIVDGRIDISRFDWLKAQGVALAVIGAELFSAGGDILLQARRLAEKARNVA